MIVDFDWISVYKSKYIFLTSTLSINQQRRLRFFKQWFNQFCIQDQKLPEYVYHIVKKELENRQVSNLTKVTPMDVRTILRDNRLNRFYEHVYQIMERVTGKSFRIQPTKEQKRTFIIMFAMMQNPWEKHKIPQIQSFPSFALIVYKFCQITRNYELMNTTFKICFWSILKLEYFDCLWKKICAELNWPFIPFGPPLPK